MPWTLSSENKVIHVGEKTVTDHTTTYHIVKTKVVLSVVVKIFTLGNIDVENEETIAEETSTTHTISAHDEIVVNTHWVETTPEKEKKPKVYQFVSSGPADGILRTGTLSPLRDGLSLTDVHLDFGGGVTTNLKPKKFSGAEIVALLQDEEALQWFNPKKLHHGSFYGVEYDLPIERVHFHEIAPTVATSTKIAELKKELQGIRERVTALHRLVEGGIEAGTSNYSLELAIAEDLAQARTLAAELQGWQKLSEISK